MNNSKKKTKTEVLTGWDSSVLLPLHNYTTPSQPLKNRALHFSKKDCRNIGATSNLKNAAATKIER